LTTVSGYIKSTEKKVAGDALDFPSVCCIIRVYVSCNKYNAYYSYSSSRLEHVGSIGNWFVDGGSYLCSIGGGCDTMEI
jgi:hypothetical protein